MVTSLVAPHLGLVTTPTRSQMGLHPLLLHQCTLTPIRKAALTLRMLPSIMVGYHFNHHLIPIYSITLPFLYTINSPNSTLLGVLMGQCSKDLQNEDWIDGRMIGGEPGPVIFDENKFTTLSPHRLLEWKSHTNHHRKACRAIPKELFSRFFLFSTKLTFRNNSVCSEILQENENENLQFSSFHPQLF